MPETNLIFIVGPMGAGKTTIGRHLAAELSLPFIDTDAEIEQRSGADIPWIFDVEGEQGFRQRESKVLSDVCAAGSAVVATGGGIVIRDENRDLIRQNGRTVYLQASIEQQLARTGKDKSRPLLNNDDPRAVLEALMQAREPIYRELAEVVYQADDRSPRVSAQEIKAQLLG
jgi:shikimate kinase